MELTNREILDRICAAEREAGALILHARGVLAECKSGFRDVVTSYDRQIQDLLIRRFTEMLPDACFFCEENDRQDSLYAARVFIIDPIDGTMNFVRGFHHSCISVALMCSGTVCAGAVYNPYADEMFSALLGEGAWLNGRPVHVFDGPLSEAVACVGTAPYQEELADRSFALMKAAFLAGLDIRREGSAALDLCSVAAGRAGLYFELALSLWDYAAGMLIVQEAGGVCLTVDGEALSPGPGKTPLAAGGRRALEDFLKLARQIP